MVNRIIGRVSPADAALLQEIVQLRSHFTDADPDLASLLRLADEPLLLNAFLQRQHSLLISADRSHQPGQEVLVCLIQTLVPCRDSASKTFTLPYAVGERESGNSPRPFCFTPSRQDLDMAVDDKGLAFQEDGISVRRYQEAWAGFVLLSLTAGLLIAILVMFLG